jgi:puromycin-sensitive aminopeptidase
LTDPLRLPTDAAPTHYDLRIETDLDGETFRGVVAIDLAIARPVETLSCNAAGLTVERVTLDGKDATWRLDADAERLDITPSATMPAGTTRLEIDFAGVLNDQLVGFYRSTYEDDGVHVLGVTQFEPTYARQAFPCWDEPAFKATFAMTLVAAPDALTISNGGEAARTILDDGRVEVGFRPTIPMSTYLVAWVVGRLVATVPVDVDGVPVRVVCRPGQERHAGAAIDIAAHALRWFAEYYGIAYPSDKLDLVAVPDFAFGAMENLGCITFREVLLILDPDELTQLELERAATVIDHEIAHMWFGDLVTMRWWDGIWLNEAFATFMELSCADAYRPDWSVWTSFGLSRSQAFATDGTSHTRPIEFDVATPKDAEAMFDVLTYEKGASVLRMVEQYLGPDTFRQGIRNYLDRHRLANTETSDLWAALDEVSDVPVGDVMTTWIRQGGHPIVEVRLDGDSASLTQRPFSYDGEGEGSWLVPVRLRAAVDGDIEERQVLLDASGATIRFGGAPSWVCANANGIGFYRTAYEGPALASLLGAMPQLSPLERFGVVDDTWALMLAGRASIADVIGALRAAGRDPEPAVMRRVGTALAELQLMAGPELADEVTSFARHLAEGRVEEDPELAGVVMRIAGGVGGDREVISRAEDLLSGEAFGAHINAELVAAAIDVVSSHGDVTWFDRFVDRYRAADTPQDELRYINALTHFTDPELQDRLLEMLATEVRTQNAPYVLAMSMSNPDIGTRAWAFMRDRWSELVARYPDNSISRMVGGVRGIWDPAAAAEILDFFALPRVPHSDRPIAQHMEMVRAHQAARSRERDRLVAALSTSHT